MNGKIRRVFGFYTVAALLCTAAPAFAQANLKGAITAERARYGPAMTADECVELLNAVAWAAGDGWALSHKASGNYGVRSDGQKVAADVLFHQPTRRVFDVLGSAGDGGDRPKKGQPATPAWGEIAPAHYDFAGRPPVAPIDPHRQPPPPPKPPDPPPPPPPPCTVTVAQTDASRTAPAAGGTFDLQVSASAASCGWTQLASAPWLTFDPAGVTRAGTAGVHVTMAANTGPARSAEIVVAGQRVVVTQDAVAKPPGRRPWWTWLLLLLGGAGIGVAAS